MTTPKTPAQPQAPAEPTQEKIEKARKLAMKIFAFHNSGNADLAKETDWIEAYAEHVAAPLREERDRLAEQLATANEAARLLSLEANEATRRADAAEAKVAERDARIATLDGLLRGAMPDTRPLDIRLAAVQDQIRHDGARADAVSIQMVDAIRNEVRAALGAPEGQPPAPPQELLGKEGAEAECGVIGVRWVCIRPPGHTSMHVYEYRSAPSAPPRKAPQGDALAETMERRTYEGQCACGVRVFVHGSTDGTVESHKDRNGNGCIAGGMKWRDVCRLPLAPSSPEEQLSGKGLK